MAEQGSGSEPAQEPDDAQQTRQPSRKERVLAQAEERKRAAQPPDARTYALARVLGKVVFGVCTGEEVRGLENVPREGPLLIVANHLSYLEPPLIATAISRRITFLAGHELYEIDWLSRVLRTLGALPVRRGGARDLDAIRAAVELLKRGEAVGIFPEGGISERPSLIRAKPGISLLAHRTGAPILPIGISGTERLSSVRPFLTARLGRPRVRVTIGKPFLPNFGPGRPDHQAVADEVMEQIAALLPEGYRGEYRDLSRES
jgi:1-acyl-sn-glycerol-3-phosphate acyltransferase